MPIVIDFNITTGIISIMKTHEAIEHFGSQVKLAAAVGVTQASVSKWLEYPSDKRQLQIERLTDGLLKAEPDCMDRLLGFVDKTLA